MYNNRKLGNTFEKAAATYLSECGITIIDENFRTRFGEIDLIGRDGRTLVFIEVKYRTSGRYGDALEAVDYRKQNQIKRIANQYMTYKRISPRTTVRFDVVGITGGKLTWIKDAFC